jgi:hypothetical protein
MVESIKRNGYHGPRDLNQSFPSLATVIYQSRAKPPWKNSKLESLSNRSARSNKQ